MPEKTAREKYKAAYRLIRLLMGKINDVNYHVFHHRELEMANTIELQYGVIGLRAYRSWRQMDRRSYKWENLHNRLGLAARDKAFYEKYPQFSRFERLSVLQLTKEIAGH